MSAFDDAMRRHPSQVSLGATPVSTNWTDHDQWEAWYAWFTEFGHEVYLPARPTGGDCERRPAASELLYDQELADQLAEAEPDLQPTLTVSRWENRAGLAVVGVAVVLVLLLVGGIVWDLL